MQICEYVNIPLTWKGEVLGDVALCNLVDKRQNFGVTCVCSVRVGTWF